MPMQYFYVTFTCPVGPGAMVFRGQRHPLHKEEMTKFCTAVARRIGLQTGNILPPEAVNFLAVLEMPPEVAASHFPQDFPPAVTP